MTTHVSITLFVHTWTDKAIGFCDVEAASRFEAPAVAPLWIPKLLIRNIDSLPDFTREENRQLEIEIPVWFAEKKALDPYCEELEDEAT